jgi:mRNA interferase MazF
VILQDDRFDGTDSVTVCAFTTDPTDAPLIRLVVEPNQENGLNERSSLMVDKVTTVPRSRLGERIGRLPDEDMTRVGRAVLVFLGFADR